ncbi:hypothetical protein EG68_07995 [Paragonimus skrjabini miyazakii]|uniref:Uncharacterized protein n=1 Tax=Paragonimus skrjabini miyazakii TaxID=59628 RepID=A0A8S9YI08_9TREM|nr:hypothetical protein EG68_07995 [Paragonimus skrjabini miyazakii]
MAELRIPLCIKPQTSEEPYQMELHSLSDASEACYGVDKYAGRVDKGGPIYCSLMLRKSRVVPIRAVSIPRMKMTAAFLVAKLTNCVEDELMREVKSLTIWPDSMIVFQPIRITSIRFETFVAIRLSSIHELSNPDNWRYVDTKRNPAGLASRGIPLKDQRTGVWFSGSELLWRVPLA